MPLQNRVLPTGEIVAHPARGTMMGNRGILHDANRRLGRARWRTKAWICCEIAFRGRSRLPMTPGRYTELFFLDEAVALAAGHRPCAECRRADYRLWQAAWTAGLELPAGARAMDQVLHAARVPSSAGAGRRTEVALDRVPNGAFVLWQGCPHLVLGGGLHRFRPEGYGPPLPRPAKVAVPALTPAPVLAVLAAGYAPRLHPKLRAMAFAS